jgi:hypothetical protein
MAREDASIIVLDNFILATRDSGYKGTTSAICELVDNSLQAGATHVWITLSVVDDRENPIAITVLDDGTGMDRSTLRQALRFGGSSRFGDREGLGRYGMGLPNSSLSQARRVEVYSWTKGTSPLYTYLDVDEIAGGEMTAVPAPITKRLPSSVTNQITPAGTLVSWSRCDRLSAVRISTIVRHLHRGLGQTFRHFLWKGVQITINDSPVEPLDPLFLRGVNAAEGTAVFGEPMKYEVAIPMRNGLRPKIGVVTVTFIELPVATLHALSNEEKRDRGIANGAGVSVVRANREVDFGWFFLGSKRRENYDDWWRAEVAFDPILDEAFGVTHTKQQIRPQEHLIDILANDMEATAKALNARVRQAHLRLKSGEAARAAEETAMSRERLLPPLPKAKTTADDTALAKSILKQYPSLKEPSDPASGLDYRIVEAGMKDTLFYSFTIVNGRFVLILNPEHPFFRHVYRPLTEDDGPEAKAVKTHLDLLLLAAARAEAGEGTAGGRRAAAGTRKRWSDNLATFLNR